MPDDTLVTTPVAVTPPEASQTPIQPVPAVEAPQVAQAAVSPPAAVVAPPMADVKAPEVVKAPETVLGEGLAKTEPAKVEPAKAPDAVEQKTTEGKSDEPAPPPVYETFKVPEGIALDQERLGKFTGILSELELSGKVPHALVQEFGQRAVDFHIAEVQSAQEQLTKLYTETWERQKTTWKDSFLKDPEIGGNRFQTTVDSALNFIRTHGGTPEQQTEFRDLMESSGLGNHPAMIRLLANAGRGMQEGKQLAASKPVSAAKSKIETMYGRQTA